MKFSKKLPIAKPPNLKWYKLSEILSLDNKIYSSYRVLLIYISF